MRIRYLNLKLSVFVFFSKCFLVLSNQLFSEKPRVMLFFFLIFFFKLKSLGFCFASLFVVDFVVV